VKVERFESATVSTFWNEKVFLLCLVISGMVAVVVVVVVVVVEY
jgi:hypothetical protein